MSFIKPAQLRYPIQVSCIIWREMLYQLIYLVRKEQINQKQSSFFVTAYTIQVLQVLESSLAFSFSPKKYHQTFNNLLIQQRFLKHCSQFLLIQVHFLFNLGHMHEYEPSYQSYYILNIPIQKIVLSRDGAPPIKTVNWVYLSIFQSFSFENKKILRRKAKSMYNFNMTFAVKYNISFIQSTYRQVRVNMKPALDCGYQIFQNLLNLPILKLSLTQFSSNHLLFQCEDIRLIPNLLSFISYSNSNLAKGRLFCLTIHQRYPLILKVFGHKKIFIMLVKLIQVPSPLLVFLVI